MSRLTATFEAESERVHEDHQNLLHDLGELDRALDRLVCHSEVYANLASVEAVRRYGERLIERLPQHFAREEATVLATVSEVSPELAEFAREMKREHEQLRARLEAFCQALEQLRAWEELDEAICNVKEHGKGLTRQLGRHIALEENELRGFL